jgi:hypothetical protein
MNRGWKCESTSADLVSLMSPPAMSSLFLQTYARYLDRGGKDGHVRNIWRELVQTLCELTRKPCTPTIPLSLSVPTEFVVSVDMRTSLLIMMWGLGCTNAHLIYGQLLPGTQSREMYSLIVLCPTFAVDHQSEATIRQELARLPHVKPRSSLVFDSRQLALLRFQVRKVSLRSTLLERAQEESIRVLRAIFRVTLDDVVMEAVRACSPPPVAVLGTGLSVVGPASQIQEVTLRDPTTGIMDDVCGPHEVPCVHNFLPRHILELPVEAETEPTVVHG